MQEHCAKGPTGAAKDILVQLNLADLCPCLPVINRQRVQRKQGQDGNQDQYREQIDLVVGHPAALAGQEATTHDKDDSP